MNDLVRFLASIQKNGLEDLAKEKAGYVWDTATRIVATGKDIECSFSEMQREFDEDTARTAQALSNPQNWGISDPAWKSFCEKWRQA